jgi:beta-phosphoglucomutase
MTRFKAVIFDLDGVITDTAHCHFLAWQRLAESLNLPFGLEFNEKLKGVDRMGSLELILAQGTRAYTAEAMHQLAEQKNEYYKELIMDISPTDLLPGAREALRSVREAGLKLGLASISRNAFTILDKLAIRNAFDHVVDASLISQGKPHPEIFLTAAARLDVHPSACLGVEDAVAGVASIKRAGMYALGVGDSKVLAQADRVIPDLGHFRLLDY